jgi:hypothetical protein
MIPVNDEKQNDKHLERFKDVFEKHILSLFLIVLL